jgi:chitodextrinase
VFAAAKHTVLAAASVIALVALAVVVPAGGAPSDPRQDPDAPTKPVNLRVTSATSSDVSVAWDPSTDDVGVEGYYVLTGKGGAVVDEPEYVVTGLACGQSALLVVIAFDAEKNRSEKATLTIAAAPCRDAETPSAPAGFTQLATTRDAVVLGWSPSTDNTGVVEYGLYRLFERIATTPEPRITLSALSCGTTYAYFVDAADAAGNRSQRSSVYVRTESCAKPTDDAAPSMPSGLAASGISQTGLSLSWNASRDNVGVVGYDVYRNGTKVASPTATNVGQAGLTCATSYSFGVAARDAAGNVSERAPLSASTGACSSPPPPADNAAPSAPTGLRVSGATGTSISLRWNASTDNVGVTGYRVFLSGAHTTTTPQPNATVSDLACGSAYTFEIDAVDAAGNRSGSASLTGSTNPCPDDEAPSAPLNIIASRTATSIALSWSASIDNVSVVGYGLYRAGAHVGTSNTTTGIFSGLACNTNYTLAVDAFDAVGNRSSKSTVMVATTACPDTQPPLQPTGLAATNVTQTGLTLTWNPASDNVGVTGYEVFRNGTKVASPTGTSSIQSGLSCGTSYAFAVVALDAARNVSTPAQISRSTSACAGTPPAPSGPITITTGGTYVGHWISNSSTPAVTIQTAQPVVIENSIIENTAGGHLVSQSGSPAQVTIRRTVFNGIAGGYGRAIVGESFKSWTVENCTLNRTGGIYFLWPGPAPSITIRKNKQFNVQGDGGSHLRQFLQLNGIQGGTILAEWNEIVNEFGKSNSEDVFSVFNTSNAVIRNNYVEGGYPGSVGASHTGTGIMLADVGGNNNVAHDNQIVGVTNLGIGITAGQNNKVYNNRVVSDGRLPDGTPLAGANNGIVIYNAYGTAMANNDAYNNVVGTYHSGNPPYRNDWWLPQCQGSCSNTRLGDPVDHSDELAERQIWSAKLAANNITVGA